MTNLLARILGRHVGVVATGLATLFALTFATAAARAQTSLAPEALFARASGELQRGEFAAAIDDFESLADRGFIHPDASFDRGLAYVMRVRARADRPGDLGRAAAAFEEALRLRPDDHDADAALDLVRAEVTRRRSRRAKDVVDARPTLDRIVMGLASEETWALGAMAASLLLATGLLLRRREGALHVAGSVLAPTAALALFALTPLAWGARHLRLTTRPGVVVATEVALTDENGGALSGDPVPEAASVEVSDRREQLIHVRWGATQGWVPASSVRLLSP